LLLFSAKVASHTGTLLHYQMCPSLKAQAAAICGNCTCGAAAPPQCTHGSAP